ncbi:MAG: hypothetical protein K6T66_14630 [Peptococcaceae bacterium]|nr:hypothetical protein [Peptococcaceae bacterium]
MMHIKVQKDLVVLVADKNMEYAIKGLLLRFQKLGIRQLTYDCFVHPEHDPGCLLRGHEFLRPFVKSYAHAIVMLDHEGSGQEQMNRADLEMMMEKSLQESGWGNRAAAIIIEPELDVWVWSGSPKMDVILGWAERDPDIRTWLIEKGFTGAINEKPKRPKEALLHALKLVKKARSSSLYFQLASAVSFDRCNDQAFIKLREVLRKWFMVRNMISPKECS